MNLTPTDEQIQIPGPSDHHDVVARLNSGCELFRGGLGTQLNWLWGIQGQQAEGYINYQTLWIAN